MNIVEVANRGQQEKRAIHFWQEAVTTPPRVLLPEELAPVLNLCQQADSYNFPSEKPAPIAYTQHPLKELHPDEIAGKILTLRTRAFTVPIVFLGPTQAIDQLANNTIAFPRYSESFDLSFKQNSRVTTVYISNGRVTGQETRDNDGSMEYSIGYRDFTIRPNGQLREDYQNTPPSLAIVYWDCIPYNHKGSMAAINVWLPQK